MHSIIHQHIPDVRNELHEMHFLAPDADVVFRIGSCVLIEIYKDKRYFYKAIDIPTGKTVQLYCRTTKLHKSSYDAAAEKIMALPFYQPGEPDADEVRGQRLIERIFKTVLPAHGYIYRVQQLELALLIFTSLQKKHIAFCEAGVGSGKTLAYVVASTVFNLFQYEKRPVLISTSTIALQNAITEEYLPQISEILMEHRVLDTPFLFIVRKGKAHYACDLRLQGYLSSVCEVGEDTELIGVLEQLTKADYRQLDLSLYPISRYVKDCICVYGRCPANCPKRESCRYLAFTRYCLDGNFSFQVSNHNLVFAHITKKSEGGQSIFPPYHAVVFDEAHKLLDAARQIYGNRLAKSEVSHILADVPLGRVPSMKNRKILHSWIELIHSRNAKLFSLLTPTQKDVDSNRVKTSIGKPAHRCMAKLRDELRHLMTLCRQHGDKQLLAALPMLKDRCDELTANLEYFMEYENLILWIECDEQDTVLCCVPKDLDRQLHRDMWGRSVPIVLTSGTLSVAGDFSLLERNIGTARVARAQVAAASIPSPFDYANNTILYIPEGMPFPSQRDRAYPQAIADEVMRLVDATHGHTVVLCTSYWAMEKVYSLTKGVISAKYPVFLMNRGRVDVLADFKASINGVLFATDAAGEGVDFAGDILSSLIIVKLPFAVPDPITEHEKAQYATLAEYQRAVTVPSMLVKLKQYVGRAIRVETDTAVISILDSRVSAKGKYRGVVLDALSPTSVTKQIEDVQAFIRRRKDASYFKGGE